MRIGLRKTAARYDEGINEGKYSMLVKECWQEGKEEEDRCRWTRWGKGKEEYFRRCGYSEKEVERFESEEKEMWKVWEVRDRCKRKN